MYDVDVCDKPRCLLISFTFGSSLIHILVLLYRLLHALHLISFIFSNRYRVRSVDAMIASGMLRVRSNSGI